MNNLQITQCMNGYRVNWVNDDDEDSLLDQEVVFEEPDIEFGNLEAMNNLLLFIKDHFGVFYSKHNKKNIVIKIEVVNE